jgi:hypothetical protein
MGLGANVPDPQQQARLRALGAWHCDFSAQHTSVSSGESS